MQRLKHILIASMIVLLLVLGVGYLLPSVWQVEQSVVIRAPAEAVFSYLDNPRQWREWSARLRQQPELQIEYSGPDAGVGATSRWLDQDGRAVMKIMQAERNRLIVYAVLFNAGEFRTDGRFSLLSTPEGTHLMWRVMGYSGYGPGSSYLALFEGWRNSHSMAESLELLKQKLETKT